MSTQEDILICLNNALGPLHWLDLAELCDTTPEAINLATSDLLAKGLIEITGTEQNRTEQIRPRAASANCVLVPGNQQMSSTPEGRLTKRLLLAASERGYRLFRNQRGAGWTGDWTKLKDGSVLIKNPRFVRYGLFDGAADFIGWRQVEVTKDMVGQLVPVFASVEIKTNEGSLSPQQRKWRKNVSKAGAIALVARSPEDLD